MSKEARALGGTIDIRKRGQSINHLICGMLGDKEIVVAACDNGDVFAFYTDSMADLIFRTPRPPKQDLMIPDNDKGRGKGKAKTTRGDVPAPPQPFFHSNVGKSAWGLAVHQKSRLIAVSSNLSEVTVFAPSLSGTRGIPGSSVTAGSRRESGQDGDSDNDTRNSKSAEEFVRKRQRNWRIIIGFGQSASNMPNISFLDDKQGNAEKVCAVDIDGSAWIGNIWKSEQPVACIRKSTTLRDFHSDDRLGMPRSVLSSPQPQLALIRISTWAQMLI